MAVKDKYDKLLEMIDSFIFNYVFKKYEIEPYMMIKDYYIEETSVFGAKVLTIKFRNNNMMRQFKELLEIHRWLFPDDLEYNIDDDSNRMIMFFRSDVEV